MIDTKQTQHDYEGNERDLTQFPDNSEMKIVEGIYNSAADRLDLTEVDGREADGEGLDTLFVQREGRGKKPHILMIQTTEPYGRARYAQWKNVKNFTYNSRPISPVEVRECTASLSD